MARPHARLLTQYLSDAPVGGKRAIVSALEARNVRYAISTHAMANPISFLSGERIVVASSNRVRILAYEREFRAHRDEAIRIARAPWRGGEKACPGVYLCPP